MSKNNTPQGVEMEGDPSFTRFLGVIQEEQSGIAVLREEYGTEQRGCLQIAYNMHEEADRDNRIKQAILIHPGDIPILMLKINQFLNYYDISPEEMLEDGWWREKCTGTFDNPKLN